LFLGGVAKLKIAFLIQLQWLFFLLKQSSEPKGGVPTPAVLVPYTNLIFALIVAAAWR
jgi:hypothetical protein